MPASGQQLSDLSRLIPQSGGLVEGRFSLPGRSPGSLKPGPGAPGCDASQLLSLCLVLGGSRPHTRRWGRTCMHARGHILRRTHEDPKSQTDYPIPDLSSPMTPGSHGSGARCCMHGQTCGSPHGPAPQHPFHPLPPPSPVPALRGRDAFPIKIRPTCMPRGPNHENRILYPCPGDT